MNEQARFAARHGLVIGCVILGGVVALLAQSPSPLRWTSEVTNQPPETGVYTQSIRWLGSPITGESLGGGPAKGLIDQRQEAGVQLGLRSDGTVVWRERPRNN